MPDIFAGLPRPDATSDMGFDGNPIIRNSEKQTQDAVSLAAGKPGARFLLFVGAELKLPQTPEKGVAADPYFDVAGAEAAGADLTAAILLGTDQGLPVLAAPLPRPRAPEPANPATARAGQYREVDGDQIDLRSLAMHRVLSREDLAIVGHAGALMNWHRANSHCAVCGTPTVIQQGGYRRGCPACGRHHFPRTDPVAIMLAVDGERCVLGRQPRFAAGMYSCLAGFVEPGETIEGAVRRELAEESGLRVGRVRYHASQPWPFPHTLMIGCFAEALSEELTPDTDELEDCRWFTRAEVESLLKRNHPEGLFCPPPMAIAHQLLRHWVFDFST